MDKRTFREVAGIWREERRHYVKPSTIGVYEEALKNHLFPAFGERSGIEEAEIKSFIFEKQETGLSARTIASFIILLKVIFKYGAKYGWLNKPEWEVALPSQRRQPLEVLTPSQGRKIVAYLENHVEAAGLGIYISLCTGMRLGEVCALRWRDIDEKNGILRVRGTLTDVYHPFAAVPYTESEVTSPKTESSCRDVPLNSRLRTILRNWKRISKDDFFVLSNKETPMCKHALRDRFMRVQDELGIPRIKFHGLRHSFATMCIENGCDCKTVSEVLGHSDVKTTLSLYVHPSEKQKRACVSKLFKLINKGDEENGQ